MRLSDAPADAPPNPRKSARSATGIGGVCGNKGGLVMALTYRTTSLAFISCHLAAHDHKARDMAETAAEMRPRYSRDRDTAGTRGRWRGASPIAARCSLRRAQISATPISRRWRRRVSANNLGDHLSATS